MNYSIITFLIFLSVLIVMTGCYNSTPGDNEIRVISYNIKFDDKSDTLVSWNQRKQRVVNQISFYDPDVLGVQEGLLHQLEDIENSASKISWIGVGRTDGKAKGEFSALFFNSEKFELVENTDSTIWLSKTPSIPSKSWDAALPRILTWGKFRSKGSGEEFYVFNTHFDHIGETARAKSARLILEMINKITQNLPVILTGDFNATEGSEPYKILTDPDSNLEDAFYKTKLPHLGPLFTFEGFNVLNDEEKKRIDYIFVNKKVEVVKHAFISDFRDGRYPSDHLPVITDVVLK